MFSFSYDYKKYIKINIMLNALMERNVDDIEVVVDFFRSHFGIWCTANKEDDCYILNINISGNKEIKNITITEVYYVTKTDALIEGVKLILTYIYYICAFKPADAYKIVNNISFYVKVIESIKKVDNDINASIKDKFDNYHLTKIDCDFPALVESLNL